MPGLLADADSHVVLQVADSLLGCGQSLAAQLPGCGEILGGFPVGAGTGGAAPSIKAADGSEFLTAAMSDGTYARAEQIYPGNDNSLRLSEEFSELVGDDVHDVG
jgi:hypothetical protein